MESIFQVFFSAAPLFLQQCPTARQYQSPHFWQTFEDWLSIPVKSDLSLFRMIKIRSGLTYCLFLEWEKSDHEVERLATSGELDMVKCGRWRFITDLKFLIFLWNFVYFYSSWNNLYGSTQFKLSLKTARYVGKLIWLRYTIFTQCWMWMMILGKCWDDFFATVQYICSRFGMFFVRMWKIIILINCGNKFCSGLEWLPTSVGRGWLWRDQCTQV